MAQNYGNSSIIEDKNIGNYRIVKYRTINNRIRVKYFDIETGLAHRTDGPATYYPGSKDEIWYKYGKIHRIGGPAQTVDHEDGLTQYWMVDGEAHREDGPAAIYHNGTEMYYQNNILHREDGPAIKDVRSDGYIEYRWYYKGIEIRCSSQEEFERLVRLLPFS